MRLRYLIEPVSDNGQHVADVCVIDRDQCVQKQFAIENANALDQLLSETATRFGDEAAGQLKHQLDAYAAERSAGLGISPALIRASEVTVKQIEWLWTSKLALGKVNLLCGDPGVNKSTLTCDFAARISTGTPWPDGAPCPKGSTLLVSAEDDMSDTIRPRLDAAYADPSKVVFLDGINFTNEQGETRKKGFTLEQIAPLKSAILELGDCKLVIIDPVSAFLADADSHKNAEIRGLLAPLAKLASETGVCIILVTHLNKAGGGKALHRAMGSLAFVAAARSAWLVTKDQVIDRRRLMLPIKNNIGNDTDGMAFTVAGDDVPRIEWEQSPVRMKADEALADSSDEQAAPGPEPESRRAAEDWLRELLKFGPVATSKVQDEAKRAGMSWATIRRAKDRVSVKAYKCQFGGVWMWRMIVDTTQNQLAHEDAHHTPTPEQHEQHEQHEHL